jgi:hypothetical protein
MMRVKSGTEIAKGRQRKAMDGENYWFTEVMGYEPSDPALPEPRPDALWPAVSMVEQDAERDLRPHFHHADQFQVFFSGSGTLGKTPLRRYSVHYANAYTPYGPIHADKDGISYFTLRNGRSGISFMPEARSELQNAKRAPFQEIAETFTELTDAELRTLRNASEQTLFSNRESGLGAWVYRVPPGGTIASPDPSVGAGQYWLIVGGTVHAGDRSLPKDSFVFVSPDELPVSMACDSEGAEILVLRFPRKATSKNPAGTAGA